MNSKDDQDQYSQYNPSRTRGYRDSKRGNKFRGEPQRARATRSRRASNRSDILDINDSSQWPSIQESSSGRVSRVPSVPIEENSPQLSPQSYNPQQRYRYSRPVERFRGRYTPRYPVPVYPEYFPQCESKDTECFKQVEYYFSTQNLENDMFIRSHMDQEGWVTLDLVYKFKRIQRLELSYGDFVQSLLKQSDKFEVDEKSQRIRAMNNPKKWAIDPAQPQQYYPEMPPMYIPYQYQLYRGRYMQPMFYPYQYDQFNWPMGGGGTYEQNYYEETKNAGEGSFQQNNESKKENQGDLEELSSGIGNLRVGSTAPST